MTNLTPAVVLSHGPGGLGTVRSLCRRGIPVTAVAFAFFSATAGTLAFSALTMGYLVRRTTAPEWLFFAAATVLCFIPGVVTDVSGIGMVAALWWWQKRKNRLELGAAPA